MGGYPGLSWAKILLFSYRCKLLKLKRLIWKESQA
jgi:hypothetical protein